jgi:signal transduction histidine kinase
MAEGVEYILEQQQQGIEVEANSDRLILVITNLLANATKVSKPDDQVSIVLSLDNAHSMIPHPTLERPALKEQMVRVTIADQGPGIPGEYRHQIFDEFMQLHTEGRRSDGTGLGLSIAKAMIEQMKGQIGCVSEVDRGTCFFVDLLRSPIRPIC